MENKVCTSCRKILPLGDFWFYKKGYAYAKCKSCLNEAGKRYRLGKKQKDPSYARFLAIQSRHNHLIRSFGISLDEWIEKLVNQNGLCYICKVRPADNVDHCHKTGRVRELLCRDCNLGIGSFKDDTILLARAAAYVSER